MNEQILAVQRMQDYIDAHLEETITLAALSQLSLFSPWYSYRLFQRHTGLKASEIQPDDQGVPPVHLLHGQPLTD